MCTKQDKPLFVEPVELHDYNELALKAAQSSPCQKRKVGAVVVGSNGQYSIGFNYNPKGLPCEDELGTRSDVVHAEIDALERFDVVRQAEPAAIYVTHPPCDNCKRAILESGIEEHNIYVVNSFMKFDAGKLRYSLMPPEALKALAEVLTYGAKKYKANNWKQGDPERYVDALYRHLEAWRTGETADSESGLSHLAHALTNIAFLIHFEENKEG